jgi:hypothetical protein
MRNGKEIVVKYRELLAEIPDMIDASGLKDKFIFEKLEMSKPTFYKKVREKAWTIEEVEKILEILK